MNPLLEAGGTPASENNLMDSSLTNTSTKTLAHLDLGKRGEELAPLIWSVLELESWQLTL